MVAVASELSLDQQLLEVAKQIDQTQYEIEAKAKELARLKEKLATQKRQQIALNCALSKRGISIAISDEEAYEQLALVGIKPPYELRQDHYLVAFLVKHEGMYFTLTRLGALLARGKKKSDYYGTLRVRTAGIFCKARTLYPHLSLVRGPCDTVSYDPTRGG